MISKPPFRAHSRAASTSVLAAPTGRPGVISLKTVVVPAQRSQRTKKQADASRLVGFGRSAPAPLAPAAELSSSKSAPTTPEKGARGRQVAKGNKKQHAIRPASQSAVQRSSARADSPAFNAPQADGLFKKSKSSRHSTSHTSSSRRADMAPQINNPSGQLASRRQANIISNVPIMPGYDSDGDRNQVDWLVNEEDDEDDYSSADSSMPATPANGTGIAVFGKAPQTAPILGAMQGFPFDDSPCKGRSVRPKHQRSPSENVFNLSSDEELVVPSTGVSPVDVLLEVMKAKHPMPRRSISSPGMRPETPPNVAVAGTSSSAPTRDGLKVKYANAVYQTSPSADVLPTPNFYA
ncbi:hypothetical protein BD626DRAFT_402132 [Schizophyllum amplum]|uniref:Uncharacterized protein n=1 Tax=Schizophyllum amplum TaxID=97359 RepID=A0A550CF51_9AGAR|nr:hypothetical protein BD626DRAFT_402132 [Auriculariopsis ampla]